MPGDAFAHTNPSAIVHLEATLADGSPLPSWLGFNQRTGTFTGVPPSRADADIEIKVTARDDAGRTAAIVFRPVLSGAGAELDSSPVRGFRLVRLAIEEARDLAPDGLDFTGTEHRLFVFHGMPDIGLALDADGNAQIPEDAFAHTDPTAVVELEARLANGEPLPEWLSFDSVSGEFTGAPPAGTSGVLEIEVIARDSEGREARIVFSLRFGQANAEASTGQMLDLASADSEAGSGDNSSLPVVLSVSAHDASENASNTADKIHRGPVRFSDQMMAARPSRDPLLARIVSG